MLADEVLVAVEMPRHHVDSLARSMKAAIGAGKRLLLALYEMSDVIPVGSEV
jgi:hypothetical protein